ncbi:MAG TPA: ATP-binding cassette domain-containing protein [Syntrophomonadaceae bacterium]|jgi:ABC-2 type transport system ATP-binding protein|nr:ATP-binding cassette domain-containing protein [Syntrophomonadaceae bacterium]
MNNEDQWAVRYGNGGVLLIEIRGLCKYYKEVKAVDNIDLHVKAGEIFGLLGPNGAGKTTTIRILTTLASPTAGNVYINGKEVSRKKTEVKKEIGVVSQTENLDVEMTARENMELHGRLFKIPNQERRIQIEKLLEFVDLTERADTVVGRFSGGMKRRLMIARALMHKPNILFLDEPTVGLDPQVRRKIWDLIRRLNGQGITVLLTTHYIEEAELLCHRVGIMNKGKLIALGTPEELKKKVGKVVVEVPNHNETEYHVFEERGEALQYVAAMRKNVVIRESNLEDVFVELTGRKVGG